jgi:hypothetical protein
MPFSAALPIAYGIEQQQRLGGFGIAKPGGSAIQNQPVLQLGSLPSIQTHASS